MEVKKKMTVFDSGSDDNQEDGLFDPPVKQVEEESNDIFDAPNYG